MGKRELLLIGIGWRAKGWLGRDGKGDGEKGSGINKDR